MGRVGRFFGGVSLYKQEIYTTDLLAYTTSASSLCSEIDVLSIFKNISCLHLYRQLLYSDDEYIKAGALLACGIVNASVRNEVDPALALLSDYVTHDTKLFRVGSIMGYVQNLLREMIYCGNCH